MSSFRLLLYPFSIVYDLATKVRNAGYNSGNLKSAEFDIPIICVGNLSTGGTGKSPHVWYLASSLKSKNIAILSRGYGRKSKGYLEVELFGTSQEFGDEALELKRSLPEIPVVVCEDRVYGVEQIKEQHPRVDLILMDDGFQHRAIKASCYVLLTSASAPFWKDHLLPAGNLRESRTAAARADLIIVTKTNSNTDFEAYKNAIAKYSNAPVFFSSMHYGGLNAVFSQKEITDLNSVERCILLTGIASTNELHDHISNECEILEHIAFPDHHEPSELELQKAVRKIDNFAGLEPIVITTNKDAVRLRSSPHKHLIEHLRIYALDMSVRPVDEDGFLLALKKYVG